MGTLEVDDLIVATTFAEALGDAAPAAPVIVTQPESQVVTAGNSASFSVSASGATPLRYQWQRNGVDLEEATAADLNLSIVSAADAGVYAVVVSNALGTATSEPATLEVLSAAETLSILTYNVKGNGVEDWSTNASQVRAIARQLTYLDPDIITFQEIPLTNTWQMTNFVAAFRPGYHLADNSGTDGYIRSVILSRYPIRRSQKWLDGVSLNPFGYNGSFTRDLFEAEIAVPGFPEPVHVFTVHLKAGQDSTSSSRRAAEANAISNFFVTGFLTTNASRPYVLTGDMNEDIDNPPSSDPETIERLTSAPTGLRLTTPVNPSSGSARTISIQTGLYARYDYILPGGLLFSNQVGSEVFRSDLLPGPPPPLLASDSATASDHLPVWMEFSNPFALPFAIQSIQLSNNMVTLTWESTPGLLYAVEGGPVPEGWSVVLSNLPASDTEMSASIPATNQTHQYYRIRRQ
jgi:endonuclease/exonuclease/phosphatase family metal-dependent hydrolase